MNRRRFLVALGAFYAAGAHAQSPGRTGKTVGILLTSALDGLESYVNLFKATMRELGWVEGRGFAYDLHAVKVPRDATAEVKKDLFGEAEMQRHAAELVNRNPDVIWVISTASAKAAFASTRTIPIVGSAVSDAVENKLAREQSKPGYNYTGIINLGWELGDKRLELLCEAMPKITRVGVLMNPSNESTRKEMTKMEAARARNPKMKAVRLIPAHMATPDGAAAAFAQLASERAEAVLITHLPLFQNYRKDILAQADKLHIPAVGHRGYFADSGALFAYGSDLPGQMGQSARLVDKILRGAKPMDIPLEEPRRFELVLNYKVAKAYGVSFPPALLIHEPLRRIE